MELTFQKIHFKDLDKIEILIKLISSCYNEIYSNVLTFEKLNILKSFVKVNSIQDEIKFDNKFFYLIELNGKDVGFLEFFLTENSLQIANIFLIGKFKTFENYTTIFKYLEKNAIDNKCDNLLFYLNRQLQDTVNLLRACGFQIVKQVIRYFGSNIYIDCYVFEKEL